MVSSKSNPDWRVFWSVFCKDLCDAKHVLDVEKIWVKSDSFTLGRFRGGGKTDLSKMDLAVKSILLLAVLGGVKLPSLFYSW